MTEQTDQTPDETTGTIVPVEDADQVGTEVPPADDSAPTEDPETFPREYVVKLRDEAAKHRQRAADRDDLAQRLHTALVTSTGRLADPSDLVFNDEHMTDADALSAAIDDLLTRKPHLGSRRIVGDVGQGASRSDSAVDLAGILRRNAS